VVGCLVTYAVSLDMEVVSTQPVVATSFSKFFSYVIDTKGVAKTCSSGYDLYLAQIPPAGRVPSSYVYISPPQMIYPQDNKDYLAMCVQVKR
jgi:hypothetical protein